MARKIRVVLVREFTYCGDIYRRYQRPDTGHSTDIKVRLGSGTVIWTPAQALAEARRRLTGRWHHPHLVR